MVDRGLLRRLPRWLPKPDDTALFAVAFAGGFLFNMLGVPAGWLTGAMLAVALASLVHPWKGPAMPVIDMGMLLSGAVIGSSATPEAMQTAARYPGSIILLLCALVAIVLATGLFLVRVGRWSRLDALLASAPGALSAVMAIGREASENLPQIAIIQFFRLFVLVAAIPGMVLLAGITPTQTALANPAASLADTAIMLGAGLAAGLAFRGLGMVAPIVLGATLASTVLHGAGFVQGSLPPLLSIAAFVILGGMIGARLGGLDRRALPGLLPLAVGAFVVSVGVAALFAWPAAWLAQVSYAAAFIAFAPGGIEAMALLAVVLGLDPLYVGTHHIVRFMAVGFLLPAVVRFVMPRKSG
jgi:membrane AbrB-like protein